MKDQKNSLLDTIGIKRPLIENSTKKAYEKKRAVKALTKASMYRMFGLQSVLNDDYRKAYMCNEYLFQNGSKITSNYCEMKCCTLCSRIKSAQNLAKYGKRIIKLDNLYLVTLTNKNVYKDQLLDEVDQMFLALKRIKKNIHQNYKKIKINGFRSFECTYSKKTGFNPHFHYIVDGKEKAELLQKLWLKQMPLAGIGGQDIRKIDNTNKSLLEVFKYIAKPVTKGYYSPTAYDEIMRSIKNHRTTESLGSIRKRDADEVCKDLELDELKSLDINFKGNKIEVWKYVHELYDYVAPDGERLLDTELDRKTINAINVINRSEVINNPKRKTSQTLFYENRTKDKTILF